MTAHNNRAGILYALCGFAMLSLGDVVIKSMAGMWPPAAIAALRFVIGAIGLGAILRVSEGAAAFRPRKPWLQLARGVSGGLAAVCFFSALFLMPLAEATAISFVTPFVVALLSGLLLGEKVQRVTWGAAAFAFVGVVLILQPKVLSLGAAAFLPLGSALFFGLMIIANRAVAGQGSVLSMQFFLATGAAFVLLLAALLGHVSGFESLRVGWPDWSVVARSAVVAVTASIAHWFIFLGTTRAGAATVAPMTYVQLLITLVLGWLVFGDKPTLTMLAGAAIIVGAGLVLWWKAGAPSSNSR